MSEELYAALDAEESGLCDELATLRSELEKLSATISEKEKAVEQLGAAREIIQRVLTKQQPTAAESEGENIPEVRSSTEEAATAVEAVEPPEPAETPDQHTRQDTTLESDLGPDLAGVSAVAEIPPQQAGERQELIIKVLSESGEPMRAQQVAEAIGLPEPSRSAVEGVRQHLDRLVKKRMAAKAGRGLYELLEA